MRTRLTEVLAAQGLEDRAALLANQRVTLRALRNGAVGVQALRQMGINAAQSSLLIAAAKEANPHDL